MQCKSVWFPIFHPGFQFFILWLRQHLEKSNWYTTGDLFGLHLRLVSERETRPTQTVLKDKENGKNDSVKLYLFIFFINILLFFKFSTQLGSLRPTNGLIELTCAWIGDKLHSINVNLVSQGLNLQFESSDSWLNLLTSWKKALKSFLCRFSKPS